LIRLAKGVMVPIETTVASDFKIQTRTIGSSHNNQNEIADYELAK